MEENRNDSGKDLRKLDDKLYDVTASSNKSADANTSTSLDKLVNNDSFDEEIEQILANFNEQTMDLTKLQTQIILLIKKYAASKRFSKVAKGKDIKIDEKSIAANIAEVSEYLIQQRSEIIKEANKELANNKDNYLSINSKSRQDIMKVIKNFAVYEIYKVMNPRRIAGETRKDNFAHNVIEHGLNSAKHYTGGTKAEIASYSPKFVKKLVNAHNSFKRNEIKPER